MNLLKFIKRWDEPTWFMAFVIALDGVATFSGLNALGLYGDRVAVSLFEAQPFMSELIASFGILAILTGIAWVLFTTYLYNEKLKGYWKDAFWTFIVISHGIGAVSWLIPDWLNIAAWSILEYNWFYLVGLQIILALLLATRVRGIKIKIF